MHRLVDEATPLAAALWLAGHQRDYLLGVEGDDFTRWRSAIEPPEAERALAVGDALFERWVVATQAELGPIDASDLVAWLERASAAVFGRFVRPFDVDFEESDRRLYADVEDQHFVAGAGSRLLRGLANCDAYSHALARVVSGFTPAEVIGVYGHRLVRVPDRAGWGAAIYLDSYAELPPFVLEVGPTAFVSIAELQRLVDDRDARYQRSGKGPGDPLRPARLYAEAKPIVLAPVGRAPSRPHEGFEFIGLPTEAAARSSSADVERVYFEARAQQLFGSPALAAELFQSIASGGDQPGWLGTLRSAARLFAARLERDPVAVGVPKSGDRSSAR